MNLILADIEADGPLLSSVFLSRLLTLCGLNTGWTSKTCVQYVNNLEATQWRAVYNNKLCL